MERTIDFGFVEAISTSSGTGSYWQPIYTTSNKPTQRMVHVKFLNKEEVEKAIKLFEAQERNRPRGGAWDRLKHYSPD
jgi:hypothetical protein